MMGQMSTSKKPGTNSQMTGHANNQPNSQLLIIQPTLTTNLKQLPSTEAITEFHDCEANLASSIYYTSVHKDHGSHYMYVWAHEVHALTEVIEVAELGVPRTGKVVVQGSVLGLNRLSLLVLKSVYNVCTMYQ